MVVDRKTTRAYRNSTVFLRTGTEGALLILMVQRKPVSLRERVNWLSYLPFISVIGYKIATFLFSISPKK